MAYNLTNINFNVFLKISKHVFLKQSSVQCPPHFEDHRHVLLQRTFSSWRSLDSESHCQQHIQEQVRLHIRQISSTSSFLHSNGHVLQLFYHITQLVYLWLNSVEVGVCAEAYQGEEPLRHINSAFMTFEVLDENGRPRPLPPIKPEPQVRNCSVNDHTFKFLFRLNFSKQI